MLTLIHSAKLNDTWLADVLARINDHDIHRLDALFAMVLGRRDGVL